VGLPGAARTILLFHIISDRPSKQPRMVGSTLGVLLKSPVLVCVFITAVPLINLFAWGEGESGGHVLRETTSGDLRGLGCPSHTSERGGEGDCVKEGGG
jgi:hypothetical protein